MLGPIFKIYNNLFGSNPANVAFKLYYFLRKKKNKKGYFKLLNKDGVSSKKLNIKNKNEIFIKANKYLKKFAKELKLKSLINFKKTVLIIQNNAAKASLRPIFFLPDMFFLDK